MSTHSGNPSTSKTVAILGANGRLSREVARAFHAAGWKVRAITRNGKSAPLAGLAGMDFTAADAMDREQLVMATAGCDFIFNGLNPLYTDWADKCMVMAENAIAAAKAHQAVHLFAGNVYHFGSGMPQSLTPDTPARPDHRKAQIRFDMERLFEEAARNDGVKTLVLRAGDFFGGDGTGSWFDQALISKLAKGKVVYPGNRNVVHAWAYLPDLAKTFVLLAEKADTLTGFGQFHFEGHNVTGDQMHKAFEAAMGKPLKRGSLPLWLFKISGLFNPMMREISEVSYLWARPHEMKDDSLTALVGALPHTPLEIAVRDALTGQGIMVTSEVSRAYKTKAALVREFRRLHAGQSSRREISGKTHRNSCRMHRKFGFLRRLLCKVKYARRRDS